MGGVSGCGLCILFSVHCRIEKEFIYRKEKQAQDNAAMAVSQQEMISVIIVLYNFLFLPYRNFVQRTMSWVKGY